MKQEVAGSTLIFVEIIDYLSRYSLLNKGALPTELHGLSCPWRDSNPRPPA